MKRLIECVPNFSEGRDLSKVDAIVAAISSVPGAYLLDRTSDSDHNRSVVTLAGEPEAVAEAAIRAVGKAAALIDLTRHTGAHPRIGATDVLPFIPLEGVTIEECVALARRVAQEIWDRFRVPVYFYEAAATRTERVNLENVRKGQFEGLMVETLRDPDRSPDIGEPRLHPTAGATAVGVRKLLIAYNVHLNTSDVSIAKKIARAIRFSSGGLRYVKAIGINLESRCIAQVSINLTDFEQTPLHRVFEMVKREAGQYGCTVTGSEIIGLIPRKAVESAGEYYLQLENFSPARVLENRLALASDARTETDAAEKNLSLALSAAQIYELWIQLEAQAAPSMLSDVRAGRSMALSAARGALESVKANLTAIRELGHDLSLVSGFEHRMAAITARLSEIPGEAGGEVRSGVESRLQGGRK